MARILLVHGSCHGAWCWRDLIPELTALGHDAFAIDLPSHGTDTTPMAEVTLDLYAQAILDALDGPTIVVGHSMAGYPISRAADLRPANIARLVYLCAYVPWDDHSLVEMRLRAEGFLADQQQALATAAKEATAARVLAEERYAKGLADLITLLESQRRAFDAESRLLGVKRQRLDARIDLYLALGGGFTESTLSQHAEVPQ